MTRYSKEIDDMFAAVINDGFRQMFLPQLRIAFYLLPRNKKRDGLLKWRLEHESPESDDAIEMKLPRLLAMTEEQVSYSIREQCLNLPMFKG